MAFDVTLKGQTFPDFRLSFNLTDDIEKVDTDTLIGKAVTQDTASANSVKLATDGSEILGSILLVEDRSSQGGSVIATVELVGGLTLPYADGQTLAVGDAIVGAGDGEVRKMATSGETSSLKVFAVDTTNKQVVVLAGF